MACSGFDLHLQEMKYFYILLQLPFLQMLSVVEILKHMSSNGLARPMRLTETTEREVAVGRLTDI